METGCEIATIGDRTGLSIDDAVVGVATCDGDLVVSNCFVHPGGEVIIVGDADAVDIKLIIRSAATCRSSYDTDTHGTGFIDVCAEGLYYSGVGRLYGGKSATYLRPGSPLISAVFHLPGHLIVGTIATITEGYQTSTVGFILSHGHGP